MFIRWPWQPAQFRIEVLRDHTKNRWHHRIVPVGVGLVAFTASKLVDTKEEAVRIADTVANDTGWNVDVID